MTAREIIFKAMDAGVSGNDSIGLICDRAIHHISENTRSTILALFPNVHTENQETLLIDIEKAISYCINFRAYMEEKAVRPWQKRRAILNSRIILVEDIATIGKCHGLKLTGYYSEHSAEGSTGTFVELLKPVYVEAGFKNPKPQAIAADIRRWRRCNKAESE